MGFAAGKRHENVRALFPLYHRRSGIVEHPIDVRVQWRARGMRSAQFLAEGYFRAAIEIAGTTVTIVGSTPSEEQAISQREIDAFWQGGSVPITSLVAVANAAERVVYGLSPTEIAALSMRFTFMTSATCPADTYRGQTSQINTVAAWHIAIGSRIGYDRTADVTGRLKWPYSIPLP